MTITTLTEAFNLSCSANSYALARSGTGTIPVGSLFYVGQYGSGGSWSIDQSFLHFDTSAVPREGVTKVKLILPITNVYDGGATLEVRAHAWTSKGAGAYVPGDQIASKQLLGSAVVTGIGDVVIEIDPALVTANFKLMICSSSQANNIAQNGQAGFQNSMTTTGARLVFEGIAPPDPVHEIPLMPGSTYLASYSANYQTSREGGGVVVSQWGWIGQYFGGQYEANQVMIGFDPSSLSGQITTANLVLNIFESYGPITLEVRDHIWVAGSVSSFVPGSQLASKRLAGSLFLEAGRTGEVVIPVNLTGMTAPFKFVLAISDQTNGIAPTADNSVRFTTGRLEVKLAPTNQRRAIRSVYFQ